MTMRSDIPNDITDATLATCTQVIEFLTEAMRDVINRQPEAARQPLFAAQALLSQLNGGYKQAT